METYQWASIVVAFFGAALSASVAWLLGHKKSRAEIAIQIAQHSKILQEEQQVWRDYLTREIDILRASNLTLQQKLERLRNNYARLRVRLLHIHAEVQRLTETYQNDALFESVEKSLREEINEIGVVLTEGVDMHTEVRPDDLPT